MQNKLLQVLQVRLLIRPNHQLNLQHLMIQLLQINKMEQKQIIYNEDCIKGMKKLADNIADIIIAPLLTQLLEEFHLKITIPIQEQIKFQLTLEGQL